jgi:hypothetical protein
MDYELLKKVGKKILDRQVSFDMDDWIRHPSGRMETSEEAACGTTACIAGHVVITAGLAELVQSPEFGWEYQLKTGLGFFDWESGALEALNPQSREDDGYDDDSEWNDLHSLFRLKNSGALVALELIVNQGATVRDAVDAAWEYQDHQEAELDSA